MRIKEFNKVWAENCMIKARLFTEEFKRIDN